MLRYALTLNQHVGGLWKIFLGGPRLTENSKPRRFTWICRLIPLWIHLQWVNIHWYSEEFLFILMADLMNFEKFKKFWTGHYCDGGNETLTKWKGLITSIKCLWGRGMASDWLEVCSFQKTPQPLGPNCYTGKVDIRRKSLRQLRRRSVGLVLSSAFYYV